MEIIEYRTTVYIYEKFLLSLFYSSVFAVFGAVQVKDGDVSTCIFIEKMLLLPCVWLHIILLAENMVLIL